ncbi:MAG TPA: hypothetical protein ENN09_02395 [Planctomycetes bacterium]|nr:hypothetical protein [Planctomycetota bacterium]
MKTPCPDCEKVKENVSALFDGELSAEDAGRLTRRIRKCADEGCGECLSLLEDLKRMNRVMKSPEMCCKPPGETLDSLKKRVLKALKNHHEK